MINSKDIKYKKPTYWNKEGTNHCVSPSRLFGIVPNVLGIFEAIPRYVMKYIEKYGSAIEKAFDLFFITGTPLRECVHESQKELFPQWLVLCDWLEMKELTPVQYEKEIANFEMLRSGSIDLVCKDKEGDLVYIEIKTHNLY